MKNKIKVGIIDDHKLFRSGVEDIINDSEDFIVTVSAGDSKDLYKQLSKKTIDVLLLDIKLKNENGLEILTHLISQETKIKIIMLTMHNEPAYVNTMIQQGAHGYLMKDTTPQELLKTISKVQQEGRYYDTYTTNILVETMQSKQKLSSLEIHFSELELTIIQLVSEGKTAEEISKMVFKSARTVEGYRKKLLDKTKTKNIAELVSWSFKNGIL